MALSANPTEYLARLDKNPTASTAVETRKATTVIDPTTGTVGGTRTLSNTSSTVVVFPQPFQTPPLVICDDLEFQAGHYSSHPWVVGGTLSMSANSSSAITYNVWSEGVPKTAIIWVGVESASADYCNGESGTVSLSSVGDFGMTIHSELAGTISYTVLGYGYNIPTRFKVTDVSTGSFVVTPMRSSVELRYWAFGVSP